MFAGDDAAAAGAGVEARSENTRQQSRKRQKRPNHRPKQQVKTFQPRANEIEREGEMASNTTECAGRQRSGTIVFGTPKSQTDCHQRASLAEYLCSPLSRVLLACLKFVVLLLLYSPRIVNLIVLRPKWTLCTSLSQSYYCQEGRE